MTWQVPGQGGPRDPTAHTPRPPRRRGRYLDKEADPSDRTALESVIDTVRNEKERLEKLEEEIMSNVRSPCRPYLAALAARSAAALAPATTAPATTALATTAPATTALAVTALAATALAATALAATALAAAPLPLRSALLAHNIPSPLGQEGSSRVWAHPLGITHPHPRGTPALMTWQEGPDDPRLEAIYDKLDRMDPTTFDKRAVCATRLPPSARPASSAHPTLPCSLTHRLTRSLAHSHTA
jgi:hypothetical protein